MNTVFDPISEPITENTRSIKTIMSLKHNVEIVYIPYANKIGVMLEDITGSSQRPLMIKGYVYYDFPERVTQDQKSTVYKAFRILGQD